MRTNRTRVVALLVAVALGGAAACGGGGDDQAFTQDPDQASSPTGAPGGGGRMDQTPPDIAEPIEPMGDPSQSGSEQTPEDPDEVMLAAALDVEGFWRDTYPEVYDQDHEELAGGLWTYGPDTPGADLPPCQGIRSYDDIAVNAFYCRDVDLIAWDRVGFIEPFIESFGAFTAAVVMAHEFGHAIQARTGDFDALAPVVTELQADCFAGAWVGHVVAGGSEVFRADLDELDLAIAGLLEIRDAPGSSPDTVQAHGSGFDRVSAFANGVEEGAARCATFGDEPPVVVQAVFEREERATQGDLPAEELLRLVVDDLEDYYQALFGELGERWTGIDRVQVVDPQRDEVACGGGDLAPEQMDFGSYYCVGENTVVLDGEGLVPALEEIGDFALGAELARQWAFAAQVRLGLDDNDREAFLHADCLTGLYAGDVYFELRRSSDVRLSPGDLDEALISFLAFGGDPEGDAAVGSPFERAEAFRTGFLGFYDDCTPFLG